MSTTHEPGRPEHDERRVTDRDLDASDRRGDRPGEPLGDHTRTDRTAGDRSDYRDRADDGERAAYRDRTEVVERDRVVDGDRLAAVQADRFGGMKLGSAFFGWLSAMGMAVILIAVLAAAGTAVGLGTGTDADEAVDAASDR